MCVRIASHEVPPVSQTPLLRPVSPSIRPAASPSSLSLSRPSSLCPPPLRSLVRGHSGRIRTLPRPTARHGRSAGAIEPWRPEVACMIDSPWRCAVSAELPPRGRDMACSFFLSSSHPVEMKKKKKKKKDPGVSATRASSSSCLWLWLEAEPILPGFGEDTERESE